MAMVSLQTTVTMMAAPHAFLEILQLIAAALIKVEVGGSVGVAQLTCMERGMLREIIGDGVLVSTGSPGNPLSHTHLREHA